MNDILNETYRNLEHAIMSRIGLTLLCLAAGITVVAAKEPVDSPKKPSVLIVNGTPAGPMRQGDFDYFQRLNQHGFQIDSHFLGEQPLDWKLIRKYNCLVILDLPPDEQDAGNGDVSWNKFPPYKKQMLPLLDAYLKQGGGIFLGIPGFGWVETAGDTTPPRGSCRPTRPNREEEAYWKPGSMLPLLWFRSPNCPCRPPKSRKAHLFYAGPVGLGVQEQLQVRGVSEAMGRRRTAAARAADDANSGVIGVVRWNNPRRASFNRSDRFRARFTSPTRWRSSSAWRGTACSRRWRST
jgi:hypothetical protein